MTGSLRTSSESLPRVIFVMGATAAGKSRLAMALAEQCNGELISVDSAQVNRGMDIGTAKPTAAERAAVPHHLLDIRDPSEPYSAADFRRDALAAITLVHGRGRTPILVGGTMLYFRALRDGLAELPAADASVRVRIAAVAAESGWQGVHDWLAQVDPTTAARLHVNDPQRIQRALEVFLLTGQTLSDRHRQGRAATRDALQARLQDPLHAPLKTPRQAPLQEAWPCELLQWVMGPLERRALDAAIDARLQQMLRDGFVDEVRTLHARGDLHADLPALKAVGYRQIWAHLDGQFDAAEMAHRIAAATRQLAKRQYTWLRAWPDVRWLGADHDEALRQVTLALNR